MAGIDMTAKLADLGDEALGAYLRSLNVPYDPTMKRLLLAVKPELGSATIAELMGEHLPALIQSPLVKAFMQARKRGAPSVSEFASQCPGCGQFLRFDLEEMMRSAGS